MCEWRRKQHNHQALVHASDPQGKFHVLVPVEVPILVLMILKLHSRALLLRYTVCGQCHLTFGWKICALRWM